MKKFGMFVLKLLLNVLAIAVLITGSAMIIKGFTEAVQNLPEPVILATPENTIIIPGDKAEIKMPAKNVSFDEMIAESKIAGNKVIIIRSENELHYWIFGSTVMHHAIILANAWQGDPLIRVIGVCDNKSLVICTKKNILYFIVVFFAGTVLNVVALAGFYYLWRRKRTETTAV